jgi:hypothetical protein
MRKTIVFAALVAACFDCLAARPLLPSGQGDQVPGPLVALPVPAGVFEHKPVSFSWALDPTATLTAPSPHQARSREYWQSVDAAELQQGVPVRFSAPGALVRLSPAAGAAPVARSGLTLRDTANRPARLQSVADAEQLQAAGMAVDGGTLVARLAPEQAAGDYRLSAPTARGRYLVHVFEPRSDVVLTAQARADRALVGSTVAVDLGIARGSRPVPGLQAQAMLVAPDGRSYPAQVGSAGGGKLTASARIPQVAPATPGLWELHVFANAQGIQRDARTAFAVVQPTARFDGAAGINAGALRVALPVQAASKGRYEARGTLYATGPDRVLRPIAQAHSAAWLEQARGMLVLDFEQAQVPKGYGAPFELRQLELHDQTRMMPLEVRTRALRF